MALDEKPGTFIKTYKRVFHDFVYELDQVLKDCDTILDVGCGKSSPIQYLPRKAHTEGVDLFKPSIDKSKALGIHDEYHQMNVLDIGKKFKPNSFDAVIALDLIEHLTKEEVHSLLKMMQRIAKKKVIVFTPNGFFHQDEFDGNVHQEHKSGWTVQDMRELGYDVIGIHGWRPVRAKVHEREDRMVRFVWLFLDLTQIYLRNHPEGAFQLLCWMQKGRRKGK
jgi:SAM-dependent methyltransferase